jgi:hypothetical protein
MTKAPPDLRSLARSHTELSVQTLAGIARNSTSDQARVAAAQALLDRGWGKAIQPHAGEEGGDIRITIREIIDERSQHASLQEVRGERLAAK